MPEAWGGTTVTVEVSARQRKNLDQLLEMILLVADLGRPQGQPEAHGAGHGARSQARSRPRSGRDRARAGRHAQRRRPVHRRHRRRQGARAVRPPRAARSRRPGPSTPVEVLGLSALPQPGDTFQVIDDPIKARQVVAYRQAQAQGEARSAARAARLTLESLQQQMAEGGMKELPLIIKADVQGSAEVLADTLAKLSDETREDPHHPHGRRRDQRVRRAAGDGVERDHHRLQRAAGSQRGRSRRAREGRHPPALDHLQRDRRDEEGDGRACSSRRSRKRASARPRCGRSFKTPKVGTIAGCMVARRPHHAQRRRAGAPAPRQRRRLDRASSRRSAGSRTTSARSRPGIECGICARPLQRHQGRRHHRGRSPWSGSRRRCSGHVEPSVRSSRSHDRRPALPRAVPADVAVAEGQAHGAAAPEGPAAARSTSRSPRWRTRISGSAPASASSPSPRPTTWPSRRCRPCCTRSSGSSPASSPQSQVEYLR